MKEVRQPDRTYNFVTKAFMLTKLNSGNCGKYTRKISLEKRRKRKRKARNDAQSI